jgi:hypothetical protein
LIEAYVVSADLSEFKIGPIMAESIPLQFDVPDMDGQDGVNVITEALRRLDPAAHVMADLDTKRVIIGAKMNAGQAAEAIEAVGFKVKAAT